MGQTNSSSKPEPDPATQSESDDIILVDTPGMYSYNILSNLTVAHQTEKFHLRFNCLFRSDCFQLQEIRKAFGFNPHPESDLSEEHLCWDRHALANFLSYAVPVEFKTSIEIASPLLLKAMIRLGSFPFHNMPAPSTLGSNEAFVAILLFTRKHERCFFKWDSDDKAHCDKYYHRLIFQVMSDKQEQAGLSIRDPADDEDLIIARNVVQAKNYTRDARNPKIGHWLPPVIEVSELPCSRSRDLTGTVPREELRALLKVLYGISRYISVYTTIDIDELIEKHGTDWLGFETVVTKLEPHFSSGFRQLFDMFINFWEWKRRLNEAGFFQDQSLGRPSTD
ncbi:hypothetical protein GGR53DRAFT_350223 [Hypoxylon sp. FL1150]|nr:hypothetical protein GGR53DRAFT_350223 [Hypoxylon sp. FL1150]